MRVKDDLFFNIDYDCIVLMGGAGDGLSFVVNKGISKLTINYLSTDELRLCPLSNPRFRNIQYRRLTSTNIFYSPEPKPEPLPYKKA